MTIYCAYDTLNPTINRVTGEEEHNCAKYNTAFCINCSSRYDGDKIKKYMEDNPREH